MITPQNVSTEPNAEESPRSEFSEHVKDVRGYARQYLAAQIARIKSIVRTTIIASILGLFAIVIGLTVLVTATIFVFAGVSGAIADLLGNRQWAGDLITGGIVLGGVVLLGYWKLMGFARAARLSTMSQFPQYKRRA